MNTADILDKAADLIDVRGLWKNWYCGPNGELCVKGAIVTAVDPSLLLTVGNLGYVPFLASDAWCDLGRYLTRTANRSTGAANWNDEPERTKEEVVSTLRAAAEAARAEQ